MGGENRPEMYTYVEAEWPNRPRNVGRGLVLKAKIFISMPASKSKWMLRSIRVWPPP